MTYIKSLTINTVKVTNRIKGLDLIDRVTKELWMEVHDIAQEALIKTIPKNKKCKKAKWLCEEALQIAQEKKRVTKGKGKKETRDLFKKIREIKGTFHAKMGTIKEKLYGPNRNRRY